MVKLFYLVLQTVLTVQCFLHQYPKINLGERDNGDPGEPLFLTPYIESGNIEEARKLARVPITESLNIRSYAGFFTVNKTYNSNQFFWYFPAMVRKDSPVVIWLQGGPGATSLYGLFIENGPLRVRNNTLEKRKYNWAINHHMIYVDNPVGTGFSFTNNSKGLCVDQVQIGEQLYFTLIQFFQMFPDLQNNKFYITGESYAGKYVPALGYTIHKKNKDAKIKINLKGLAIGNGLCDPENQFIYSKYLYQIGLLDWNQEKIFLDTENNVKELIKQQNWDEAYKVFDNLMFGELVNRKSVFYNMTGFEIRYNFLHTKDYTKFEDFHPMIQSSSFRKEIHVGNLPFNDGRIVEMYLKQDFMQSVAPWISELLNHYNIFMYNGQLDIILAYPLTINFLRNLNFTGSEFYKTAKRHHWYVDNDIAGYWKRAGKLTEIMVRNAGHMVPTDQPKWALDLIMRLTHDETFTRK